MTWQRIVFGYGLLGVMAWLVLVVVCVLPVPPARDAQSPEPRPVTVVPASPTVYVFPTMTPVPSPEALPSGLHWSVAIQCCSVCRPVGVPSGQAVQSTKVHPRRYQHVDC